MPLPTVALIHGFAGSPEAWSKTAAAWPAPTPQLVPLRLPGHAADYVASADGTFQDAVDTLLDQLPGSPVGVVGYSLGARIALGLAVQYPDRVSALTLIGVNPGLPETSRPQRREHDERWARQLETEGLDAFLEAWIQQPIFSTQASLPPDVRAAQRAQRRSLNPHQLAAAMRQMSLGAMPDYREAYRTLDMPTQLVVGALDAKFLAIVETMKQRRAPTRVDVIAGVGHNVPLEAPASLAVRLDAFHAPRGR